MHVDWAVLLIIEHPAGRRLCMCCYALGFYCKLHSNGLGADHSTGPAEGHQGKGHANQQKSQSVWRSEDYIQGKSRCLPITSTCTYVFFASNYRFNLCAR